MSIGIYVHIPFCKSKCKYCDFNSSDKLFDLEDGYVKALITEIESCEQLDKVDTVFIGGGTPTAIKTENLLKIINSITNHFNIDCAEFTVECNPATASYEDFVKLKNAGVNRISIGLQSANDEELAYLGRIHNYSMFENTYNDCVNAGIENINVDLIFSLHQQNLNKWKYTLDKVTKLKPTHISCYSLIIEEGTPFFNMEHQLPDEEADREMYNYTIDFLGQKGYKQYEISNFALDGYRCKHNIKYWQRANYLGFGCGACGMYEDVRTQNTYDIKEYINNNQVEKTAISKEDAMAEHIFLGLRLTEGFDIEEFNQRYGVNFIRKYSDIIDKFTKTGLMELDQNCKLTRKGVSVSNSIMCEFL